MIIVKGMDCIENAMLDVCKFHLSEYEILFYNSLQISYKKKIPIGDGAVYDDKVLIKNVEEIFGYEFKPLVFESGLVRKNVERAFDQYGRLILGIRSNYCPWQKTYGTSAGSLHFLVLTGIDEEGLICADSLPKRDNARIKWEDAEQGLKQIVVLQKCKKVKLKKIDKETVIAQTKKSFKPKTIKKLTKLISHNFDPGTEFKSETYIWRVPIYGLVQKWYSMHMQFDVFLKKYDNKMQWNKEIVELNNSIVRIYEEIKIYIVKIFGLYSERCLSKNDIELLTRIIVKKMDIAAEKEIYLKNMIIGIEGYIPQNNITQKSITDSKYKMYSVPIKYTEKTHFVSGRDYKTSIHIPYGKEISIGEDKYCVPALDSLNDCMPMNGQEYVIDKKINKIVIMGYGTYESQIDFIRIYYGEKSESKTIAFSDWTQEPLNGEEVLVSGKFYPLNPDGMIHKGKLVAVEVPVEREEICSKIVLPRCNRIIVVAMWIGTNE
ncbi:hypothetical protein [Eubacterium xylanophilum]|uniref:hypothetical protein n=1 Tax=Eubacterium xylanophilum TaxID=39497 RepID=UPI00047B21F1|nr:hypothetical protein [Eubacterium xylanophilum]